MTISAETKPLRRIPVRPYGEDGYDNDGYIMSDGKPMAESFEHQEAMVYAIFALRTHFQDRPDVYVMGNDFVHYKEGDRNRYLSPDCYVVFGVEPKPSRSNFKVWEEGKSPSVVFEMTSIGTRREDETTKYEIYKNSLKSLEYFRFDPQGEYLNPKLRGDVLTESGYQPLIPDTDGRLYSKTLGLKIGYVDMELRFYNPDTGVALLSPRETTLALEATERLLRVERELRLQLEQEMERLRAEIAALKQS